jgi:hypothetical protein
MILNERNAFLIMVRVDTNQCFGKNHFIFIMAELLLQNGYEINYLLLQFHFVLFL